MNDTATAPLGATAPKVRQSAKADAASQDVADLRTGLARVADDLESAIAIDGDNYPYAVMLMSVAQDHTRALTKQLPGLPDDEFLSKIFAIEASVMGARDMEETPKAVKMLANDVLVSLLNLRGGPGKNEQPTAWLATGAATSPAQIRKSRTDEMRSLGERQSGWTFSGISTLADATRTLCIDVIDESTDAWDDATINKIEAIEAMSKQIGLLCDIGAEDCNDPVIGKRHSDPRGWLCPPAYHSEKNKRGNQQ